MTIWYRFVPTLLCVVVAGSAAIAAEPPKSAPPRAYVIADIKVTDSDGYRAYVAAISPIVKKHGGNYIVRAGRSLSVEGDPPIGRVVVIEFPSFAAAEAFEASPETVAAGEIRHRTATSRIFVVEGSSP